MQLVLYGNRQKPKQHTIRLVEEEGAREKRQHDPLVASRNPCRVVHSIHVLRTSDIAVFGVAGACVRVFHNQHLRIT